jgi:hypothetical protein
MAYASASDVYMLTPALVLPASGFDVSTCPTLTQVNSWLSAGSAIIDSTLYTAGLNPIPAGAASYPLATQVNALFGAWMAERSKSNAIISATERQRADLFKKDFTDLLAVLSGMDLSRAGVPEASSRVYAGGISQSDKQTAAANTDRVPTRFSRGMGRNPLRLDPNQVNSSAS